MRKVRALPCTVRANRSRPSWSVPNRWFHDGACSLACVSVSNGPCRVITSGAKAATTTKAAQPTHNNSPGYRTIRAAEGTRQDRRPATHRQVDVLRRCSTRRAVGFELLERVGDVDLRHASDTTGRARRWLRTMRGSRIG